VLTNSLAATDVAAVHGAAGGALLDDREADLAAGAYGQQFLHALGPLRAAEVGRHDADGPAAGTRRQVVGQQRRRLEVVHRAAERALERGQVVGVEADQVVGTDGLEQLRHVAQRDRVALLGATILARIGEVRHAGGDAGGAGVLQAGHQEQQPTQAVVGAGRGVAGQRMQQIDTPAAHRYQRASLVFTALVVPLLERC